MSMDRRTAAKEITRARKAQELLENPLLQEAFSTIEKETISIWQATKTSQTELREQAWLTVRAMQLLRQQLQSWVNDGKIASKELEREQAKQP